MTDLLLSTNPPTQSQQGICAGIQRKDTWAERTAASCTSGQPQAVAQDRCELKFDLLGWMHVRGIKLVNHLWGLCG